MNDTDLQLRSETVKEIPLAAVELLPETRNWPRRWLVIACPFCGAQRSHQHGAGRLSDNPADTLGRRVAHCKAALWSEMRPAPEYQLVWVTGEAVTAVM